MNNPIVRVTSHTLTAIANSPHVTILETTAHRVEDLGTGTEYRLAWWRWVDRDTNSAFWTFYATRALTAESHGARCRWREDGDGDALRACFGIHATGAGGTENDSAACGKSGEDWVARAG